MPGILGIITHLSTLVSLGKAVESFVGEVVKTKQIPVGSDPVVRQVLESAKALFDSGLIQIPGVDDKAISDAIALIEKEVCGS